jgi:hypothetical protein
VPIIHTVFENNNFVPTVVDFEHRNIAKAAGKLEELHSRENTVTYTEQEYKCNMEQFQRFY